MDPVSSCRSSLNPIVPLKQIEYGFGYTIIRPIFYLLKGGYTPLIFKYLFGGLGSETAFFLDEFVVRAALEVVTSLQDARRNT